MATAVVCDDDSIVRAAISVVCAEAGLEVVAETDRSVDAAEMVRRFGVDVLILELSLGDGSGEHLLAELQAEGTTTTVIVFTAFGNDPTKLLRLGAREVVEKPDFELLGAVLAGLGSPAGVSSHHDLAHSMLTPGGG